MKKLAILFSILTLLVFIACGDDTPQETTEEVVELKGFEELNLTEYGFNLTVMVPEAENNGEAQVVLTERGALEIVVGSDFGIEIMYGEGDLALLKSDLNDDLVFVSSIIAEDSTSIIYSQDIPESGVKTQHHFFYKAVIGTDIYEVRDIMESDYGSGMIEKMLGAAKTLRASQPKIAA